METTEVQAEDLRLNDVIIVDDVATKVTDLTYDFKWKKVNVVVDTGASIRMNFEEFVRLV